MLQVFQKGKINAEFHLSDGDGMKELLSRKGASALPFGGRYWCR